METRDYYAVLGIDRAESVEGIHTAYRKLAKQCHPDRAGMQGKEQFQAIQQAYEVLSDTEKRKKYDASVDPPIRVRRDVEPEPLVPSHNSFRYDSPEPLVRPSCTPEDLCVSSHCEFCGGTGVDMGFPCLFCRGLDLMPRDMRHIIRSLWLRSL